MVEGIETPDIGKETQSPFTIPHHKIPKVLRKIRHPFVVVAAILIIVPILLLGMKGQIPKSSLVAVQTPTPTPKKDKLFISYTAPSIATKSAYTIFLVGDSMTHALGPHGGTFNGYANDLYKPHNQGILIDNYASGSTNILTLKEAMTTKATYWDSSFEPLLSRDFDLIMIESFGYNPLSDFTLEEGKKKQNEILTEVMTILTNTHPDSAVVFVATISPNKEKYALPVNPYTSLAERTSQVEERIGYIKNHIDYANAHNIPLVNIFEKSLNAQGDGDLKYINPNDGIHPSFAGVDFIGHELANFIYNNNILPR